jgi:regulator of protease activity HflC (stomatin/prohibitin superfamily)
VPSLDLDDVFLKKDEVAQAVKGSLGAQMSEYGYDILTALVTDIDPDERVKAAMNEINANQRLLEAAKAKGEAEKVLKVKQAEAEAESKALQGNGIARERTEIARGLHDSAAMFQQGLPGATVQEAMVVLLLTQYFDMLKEVGGRSNTIMLPHSPGGLSDIAGQIRSAIIASRQVPEAPIDHDDGAATAAGDTASLSDALPPPNGGRTATRNSA